MVENLKQHCVKLGINVVNVAEAPVTSTQQGCGCATMSRNDPPHLVGLLDLLRQGKDMGYHQVRAGDAVNETTGTRHRLQQQSQLWVIENAKKALENMILITEGRI